MQGLIPYTSSIVPRNSNGSSFKVWNIFSRSVSSKIRRNIIDMRERLKEETKVIENCLKTKSVPKKESSIHGGSSQHRVEKEIPVFNPSNYKYKSYPHSRGYVYKNSETYWYLQTENIVHNDKREAKHVPSPVFEIKSRGSSMHTSKFSCVPSQC